MKLIQNLQLSIFKALLEIISSNYNKIKIVFFSRWIIDHELAYISLLQAYFVSAV